jgi:hypothetical protein
LIAFFTCSTFHLATVGHNVASSELDINSGLVFPDKLLSQSSAISLRGEVKTGETTGYVTSDVTKRKRHSEK